MRPAKIVISCALATLVPSACGSSSKSRAGSPGAAPRPAARGVVDDPRTTHIQCLREHRLAVTKVGQTDVQVGSPPGGPTIRFEPTPGSAQQAQISGSVPDTEVIGSALVHPNQAPDAELKLVEDCLAIGVKG